MVTLRLFMWTELASFLALAATRILLVMAPRPNVRATPSDGQPHVKSGAFIAWFVSAYQRSKLRDRFKGEGKSCVYLPTCTDYAHRAVVKYGLFRGLMLTGDRFRRCREGGIGSYIDFP